MNELFKLVGTIAIDNSEANRNIDDTTAKAGHSEGKLSGIMGRIGSVTKKVGKAVAIGIGAVATGLTALTGKAMSEYAEYEQLVGGVETLFKDSSDKVIQYSHEAYKTAGMSANEYMDTVTSFSASLIQSLGGDTQKATEVANQTIIDMSDNANKMGTDIGMIQNAYQGFAKQNFTMLDNLKLGYGGTQEEMQRLLADAEKLSGVHYDLSSFADISEAIHVIQTEMDITGTTSKEASTTIQGSIGMVKASFTNFLTGMADPKQDFDKLLKDLVDSVIIASQNIVPRLAMLLPRLVQGLAGIIQALSGEIPKMIGNLLPAIISGAVTLMHSLVDILPSLIQIIVNTVPLFLDGIVQIMTAIVVALPEIITMIINVLPTLITQIVDALIQATPILIAGSVQLVLGIVDALPIIIKSLVDAIPRIVKMLVTTILTNLPKFIAGAVKLVAGIVKAIPQIISLLIKTIPAIISGIVHAFVPLGGKLVGKSKEMLGKVKNVFVDKWNSIKNVVTEKMDAVKNKVSSAINSVKSFISGGLETARNTVSTKLNSIKEKFSSIFNKAKEIVKTAIDKIKGFFKFDWHLPKLKLPHLSITGKLGIAPPQVPKFDIDWYDKAMENGMIMNEPTIFGFNDATKKFMAGGETGSETVVGTGSLRAMIENSVRNEMNRVGYLMEKLLTILEKFFPQFLNGQNMQMVLDTGVLVGETAELMDERLGIIYKRKGRQ